MDDAAALPASAATSATAASRRLRGFDLVFILAAVFASFIFAFLAAAMAGGIYGFIIAVTTKAFDPAIADNETLLQTSIFVGVGYATAAALLGAWGVIQLRDLDRAAVGLKRARAWWWFAIGLAALALLIAYEYLMVPHLDPDGSIRTQLQKRLLPRADSLAWAIAIWILVAPATAITEEILHRGLLYRWFRERLPLWLAVLLSALIFGLMHGSLISPGGWMGASMALSLTLFGAIAALLFEGSGSLWPSILMHFVNNSLFIIGAYHPGAS